MSGAWSEQLAYAALQDAEAEADKLDPAAPRREHEQEAERAERLCHELAAHFAERGAGWRIRLARYREHRQAGE